VFMWTVKNPTPWESFWPWRAIDHFSWERRYRFLRFCFTQKQWDKTTMHAATPDWLLSTWAAFEANDPTVLAAWVLHRVIRSKDLGHFPVLLYALIIAIEEGLWLVQHELTSKEARFLRIAARLPIELQQVLANRTYGVAGNHIAWSEVAWYVINKP